MIFVGNGEKYWDLFDKSALYAGKICEYSDRFNKLIKYSNKYMKVLEKTYQKTEKAPTFPAGEALNVTTLRDKAKFFEIILSVKNPEFTHFLEVLGKGAENKSLIDRGYVQLLPILQFLNENAKIEFSYHLLAAKLDTTAKVDYIQAVTKRSNEEFKNWLFASFVSQTEEKDQAFFKELLSQNIFEKETVEKFVNDKVVGQICKDAIQPKEHVEKVEQVQEKVAERKPQHSNAAKQEKAKLQ